jgi:hypothetical protein
MLFLCACSASVVEESFYYLDAPVERICGADVPMPYAANLERLAVPQVRFISSSSLCISWLLYIPQNGCWSTPQLAGFTNPSIQSTTLVYSLLCSSVSL